MDAMTWTCPQCSTVYNVNFSCVCRGGLADPPAEHALLLAVAEEATRLRQELLASRDWPQWARFCAALDALTAFREAHRG